MPVDVNRLQGFAELSAAAQRAVSKAIASKGKYAGYITRSAPKDLAARAARQAMLMRVNTFKVSVGAIMFLDDAQRAVYDEVARWVDALPKAQALELDKDRNELEAMGVW